MSDNVTAEIVAIGTELLLGEITDTNSVFIAQQLRDIGINVFFMTSVGDNQERIASAIRIALSRADVVITCGGLGPTIDDMTRQGIAIATDRDLVFHQSLQDQIAARFASYNVKMTENNTRQAYLPADAIAIENPVGTAPSFIVEVENKAIISIPGVPREMKYLMVERVIPYLTEKYDLGIIKARILRTAGIGESHLDTILGVDILEQSNPTIGLAAHHGTIDVRLTAKAASHSIADGMLDELEAVVRERAGDYIFGYGKDEIEDVLIKLLQDNNMQIGVIEVGIQSAIIDKLRLRKVDSVLGYAQVLDSPDKVSNQFPVQASTMREQSQELSHYIIQQGCTASVAIISLPDVNENADLDYATAVAITVNGETKSRVYGFGGQNELAREWVSRWAMANIWRGLKEQLAHVE